MVKSSGILADLETSPRILPKTDIDERSYPNYSFGANRKSISPLSDIGVGYGVQMRGRKVPQKPFGDNLQNL